MKVGFIGLGIMGKPMVKNLLKAGNEVLAFDIIPENVSNVVAAGAKGASSIAQVAKECKFIITMLPNGPQVKDVVLGSGGVIENAALGTILVDMSSIAPGVAQEVYVKCAEKGIKMLDAPVSGGEPKAVDGTLSVMVGGDEAVFDMAKETLMAMASSVVLCGEIGAGNVTKLANQVIVALNITAVSEAFMLSTKSGVDPQKVFEAIKGGLAGSTVMNMKLPMILDGNFNPGFKIDLHIKDLANALDTGHEIGSPLPFTAAAMEVLQTLKAHGYGGNDHCGIARYYEKLADLEIRSRAEA